MAKVIGVGGIFFKSQDPEKLGDWYQQWLGIPVNHPYGASFDPAGLPGGGFAAWCPFPADTKYFDPADRPYMFNLMVDDLDGALAQVQEGGAELAGDVEEMEYGRFGWFVDPEGNKVELWQPPAQPVVEAADS